MRAARTEGDRYARNMNAASLEEVYRTRLPRVRRIMKELAPFTASIAGAGLSEASAAFGNWNKDGITLFFTVAKVCGAGSPCCWALRT